MKAFFGLLLGIAISLGIAAGAGENPLHVLRVIGLSALGSPEDVALTLFYATSLIFTGLSVAFALRAGLFNIGAEGQLTISAITLAAVAPSLQTLPLPVFLLGSCGAALLAGFLWGAIPGWIKAYRGGHEVVITMMLNFVAASLANYLVVGPLRDTNTQNPESIPIDESVLFRSYDPVHALVPGAPLNLSLVIAIAAAIALWIFFRFTRVGFRFRAAGIGETAARLQGIPVRRYKWLALAFAGMLAGGVALNEILGASGKYRLGFSADYGFVGIAVALLARGNPIGVVFSALLFGILQKGAGDLDLETDHITRDFSRVMQAVIILSISVFSFARKKGARDE